MIVCPKCGFRDWYWRSRAGPTFGKSTYEEICNLDDFEKQYPSMVSDVRLGKTVSDGLYVFKLIQTRRSKVRFSGGLVKRKAVVDYKMDDGWGYGRPQCEKPSVEIPIITEQSVEKK